MEDAVGHAVEQYVERAVLDEVVLALVVDLAAEGHELRLVDSAEGAVQG